MKDGRMTHFSSHLVFFRSTFIPNNSFPVAISSARTVSSFQIVFAFSVACCISHQTNASNEYNGAFSVIFFWCNVQLLFYHVFFLQEAEDLMRWKAEQ